eukprot:SAG11_NODE_33987_length_274_cov_0.880000_1_plen_73_part_01
MIQPGARRRCRCSLPQLRPDGGFLDPSGGAVQRLVRGNVALGGADLARFDKLEDRLQKFKNHRTQNFSSPCPM